MANFVFPFAVFSLFSSTGVSKCEIRNQGAYEDYILRLNDTFDYLLDFKWYNKNKVGNIGILVLCWDYEKL